LDKDYNFIEGTLEKVARKPSGPPRFAPLLTDLAIDLFRHSEDAGARDEPLGPASWQEWKIFLLGILASGKK
jgi:hypothetical protein